MLPLAFLQDQLSNSQEYFSSLEDLARFVCAESGADWGDVWDYCQRHGYAAACDPLYGFPEERP